MSQALAEAVALGRGWQRRIEQSRQWIDNEGQPHDLSSMTDRYLLNCHFFLLRHATQIQSAILWSDAPVSPQRSERLEHHEIPTLAERIGHIDPSTWIRSTPIFLAIDRELDRRGQP